MSNAIGASSSNALSCLQSLLQQGAAGAKDAKGTKGASGADPLSMFMEAMLDNDASPLTGSAVPSPKAIGSRFSADTMSMLISAQAQ